MLQRIGRQEHLRPPTMTLRPLHPFSAWRPQYWKNSRNLDPWLRYSLAPLYDRNAQAFKDTWIPLDLPFKITPWRAINTAVIFSFGLAKAIATYRGLSTAPTTLDWMLGVTWTLM
jgi:hypothetical protein